MSMLILNADVEQFAVLQEIGWDGAFVNWSPERRPRPAADEAKRLGLLLQSVHAPFDKVDRIWEEEEEGDAAVEEQLTVLRDTADAGVDLVVQHAIIGMDRHTPTALGLERFGKIFDEAGKLGVRVAMENTEGEEYLRALLENYGDLPHVGFCIDTGHELCYNYGRDMIGMHGRKVFGTHLNDNMGMTGETLTWLDDAHLLPYDGVADWESIALRLHRAGFSGPLTFELSEKSKPGRHLNDGYAAMSYADFCRIAFERAQRFAVCFRKTAPAAGK